MKVPLIVYDPAAASDARGTVCDELVETIDLVPTFLDAVGADWTGQSHRLEGRSLMPFLRGEAPARWRPFAISEYDYSMSQSAVALGVEPRDARLFMVCDKRWKYIEAVGFRPMLFDMADDPERIPRPGRRSGSCGCARPDGGGAGAVGAAALPAHRVLGAQIKALRGKAQRRGILIGVWDEADIPSELWSGYLQDGS